MRFQDLFLPAILVVVVFVLFGRTRDHDFALDAIAVVRDGAVVQGRDVAAAFTSGWWDQAPTDSVAQPDRLYRPLTLCWFMLVDAVSDGGPGAQHTGVVLLHILATLARYALLLALFRGLPHARAVAYVGALLAATHGMAAEAVVNVVGADEILCQLFLALSWLAFTFALGRRGPLRGGAALGLATLGFAAAMLCKETGALVPALFFLQALLFPRGLAPRADDGGGDATASAPLVARGLRAALMTAPFAAVIAGWVALRLALFGTLANFEEAGVYVGFAALERVASSLATLGTLYLPSLFWPFSLAPSPGHQDVPPPAGLLDAGVIVGAAVWGLALFAAVRWSRRRRPEGLLAVFGILTFLPVSNLLIGIGAVAGHRFFYGPLLAIGGAAAACAERLRARHPAAGMAALVLLHVFILVGAIGAWKLTDAWKDQPTLSRYAYEASPRSVVAMYGWLRDDVMRPTDGVPDFGNWDEKARAFDALEPHLVRVPSSGDFDTTTKLMAYRLLYNRAAVLATWAQQPDAGADGLARVHRAQVILARAEPYARGRTELEVELHVMQAKMIVLALGLAARMGEGDAEQRAAALDAMAAELAFAGRLIETRPDEVPLRLKVDYHEAARDLAEFSKDDAAAARHVESAYTLDPDDADTAYAMFLLARKRGDRDRAFEIADRALAGRGASVGLAHEAADLAAELGRSRQRRDYLTRGVALPSRSYQEEQLARQMRQALAGPAGRDR